VERREFWLLQLCSAAALDLVSMDSANLQGTSLVLGEIIHWVVGLDARAWVESSAVIGEVKLGFD
jgi:hypothetical protein